MTILLALAIFGLMLTICVHFLIIENKRIAKNETDVQAYWRPAYATKRNT